MSSAPSPQSPAQILPAKQFVLKAYSCPDKLSLKQTQSRLPAEFTERYNQDCLIFHKEYGEKVFIFKFGTVVFLNVPAEEHQAFLAQIGMKPKIQVADPEEDVFTVEDFLVKIEGDANDVTFNEASIPKFDIVKLQLISQVLAQSSALELLEWEVEEFMIESEKLSQYLKKSGLVRSSRHKLIQFLGEGLNARHRMVNQLALLDDPEKTWEKEDLYKLYIKLFDNFDIQERIEKIEKMLELSSDVTDLLLAIGNTRRQEILELIIIGLIGFEILQTLLK